jgi:hypothetical protein
MRAGLLFATGMPAAYQEACIQRNHEGAMHAWLFSGPSKVAPPMVVRAGAMIEN